MKQIHRSDSIARKHYCIDQKSFISFHPELIYSGLLNKTHGWSDTLHIHKFLEIIYIADGAGSVTVDGQEYSVKKDDIIIYNAGANHCEHNEVGNPMEAYFLAYDKIQLRDLPQNCILPLHSSCVFSAAKIGREIFTLVNMVNTEIVAKDEFYIEIAGVSAHTLLMYIFRLLNEKKIIVEPIKKDSVLQDVLRYMDLHFAQEIGLEDIAAKCFVNKYYLSHLFTEHLGMTVGQYVREKRIAQAKLTLSQSDLSVANIAEQCGFNDFNYFIRLFKKTTGLTPLQYRKKNSSKRSSKV